MKQTLERDFDLSLSMTEIRQLTISRLRQMATEESGGETRKQEVLGTGGEDVLRLEGASLRYDLQHLMPKEMIVLMKEGPPDKPVLFVVHPLEGKLSVCH